MAFNVNDGAVEALLDQLMRKSGIKTKVSAIRISLQHELERLDNEVPLRVKFDEIRERKKTLLGDPVAGVDHKKMMDELWEEGK